MRFVALHIPLILGVKVLHNTPPCSCNTVMSGLPDMYTRGLRVDISINCT